jgi:lantibiotic leader peptide-processing serine protease
LSTYLQGILYAADHGADVIHMAFVIQLSKRANPGLVSAVIRAINYAHRKGAVLVTAAGNTGAALNVPGGPGDFDQDEDRFALCGAPHVICAAATGPTSASSLTGPWQNIDAITPYSNFGVSAIDVAAPGGTGPPGAAPAVGIWVLCSQTAIVAGRSPCRAGENLIMSSTGTSWSGAMTSGLAALLVSAVGKGRPDQIRAIIEQSADDLGARGTDARYGKGRINVARALRAIE